MRAVRVSILWLVMVGGAASAQKPPETPQQKQAKALFLEGRDQLVNKKNAKAACDKFLQSYQLDPTAPGVMLNLGLCSLSQGKFATSMFWFRKAQTAAAEAKLPAYEDEAKRHTVELASKLSTIRIVDAPADAEILIDGTRIEPKDYSRVEVDPGTRNIEARAPGKQVFKTTHAVTKPGDAGAVTIVMVDEIIRPTRTNTKRYVLGGASIGTGVILGIVASVYANGIKQSWLDGMALDAAAEKKAKQAEQKKLHLATGIFSLGVVAAGLGVYLIVTAPDLKERRPPATVVTPIVDANQLGLSVSGSF